MAARKFKTGDKVIFSVKAPKYFLNTYKKSVGIILNFNTSYRISTYSAKFNLNGQIKKINGLYSNYLEHVENSTVDGLTIDSLLNTIKDKESQLLLINTDIKVLNEMVSYMRTNSLKVFNEKKFKSYKIMKISQSSELNENEKIKAIEFLIEK